MLAAAKRASASSLSSFSLFHTKEMSTNSPDGVSSLIDDPPKSRAAL